MSAASSGSGTIPRPPTSPTSVSTRSSTAARSRRASSLTTANASTSSAAWGWSPTSSAASGSSGCRATRAIGHVRYSTAGGSNLRERAADRVDYAPRLDRASPTTATWSTPSSSAHELEAAAPIFQSTLGHRGHRSPHRARAASRRSRTHRRGARPGAGRLLAAVPDARRAWSACAIPYGLPPAVARTARRTRGSLATETCALDLIEARVRARRGARRDGRHRRRRAAHAPARSARARACSASSSTSTSRGPTRCCAAATSTRSRKALGRQLAARAPRRRRPGHRRCPTRACPRPSATPRSRASRSTWGWCAATTSGAPSSSRASHPPLRRAS